MRRRKDRGEGKGALEILEEAAHLLRRAPAGCLVTFYLGSLPFVLGLLFFWSDMRRSAFAYRYAGEASLGVALLYLWMKGWHAVFARQLRACLSGAASAPGWRGWLRLSIVQATVQPTSLFVLPFALLVTLPFGWVYAFYQSDTVTGEIRAARRQAELWPKQNHLVIATLFLFGIFVFLNLATALLAAPQLLKTLFGIETASSRSLWSLLNSTFFMVVLGLTYLALGPLAKAAYVLRCFYGDSLRTGEDLKADLRSVVLSLRRGVAAALLAAALLGAAAPAFALVAAAPVEEARGVPPADLDRAIREVIARREFAWRLPRQPPPQEERRKGILGRFFDAAFGTLARLRDRALRAIARLLAWIDRVFFRRLRTAPVSGASPAWLTSVQGLLALLLTAVACAAGLLLWNARRRARRVVLSEAVAAAPDLETEDSAAGDVPVEQWMERARDLIGRGELRQAVRALYLASLSYLARRDLITLARFKSNRDYETELRRRGRSRPALPDLFAENVTIFERVWYGRHEATQDLVRAFATNLEGMQADAKP